MTTSTEVNTHETDIDFLPARYREHTEQRKGRAWRLSSIILLAMMLPVASFYQMRVRSGLQRELSGLQSPCAELDAMRARLAAVEKNKQHLESQAKLIAYLHHPWPRSQVLTALLPPLPESMALTTVEVELVSSSAVIAAPVAKNPHLEGKAPATDLAPAEKDIKQLRERHDNAQVVVQLSGVATDPGELHAYLGRLAGHRLFVKTELLSLEAPATTGAHAAKGSEGARFRARLILAQSPGQPLGPQSEKATAGGVTEPEVATASHAALTIDSNLSGALP